MSSSAPYHGGSQYRRTRNVRQDQKNARVVRGIASGHYLRSEDTKQSDCVTRSKSQHFGAIGSNIYAEIDFLTRKTDQLTLEVRQERSLLAQLHAKTINEGVTPALAENADDRIRAAEMLVELDKDESEMVLGILGTNRKPISEVVGTLGAVRSVRISGMLAGCHAAFVENESIAATKFGRSLFEWIMAPPE